MLGGKRRMKTTIAALCFFSTAATAAFAQGPAGHWRGDDGMTPTVATDSSGNNRHGTYASGATTSTSVNPLLLNNPTSMSFDGADDVVNVGTFPWPTGGPVTVAFWNFVPTGGVKDSSAFTVGAMDNANRFHVHGPWSDSNLYWDYGDLNANGRISTSYAAYVNAWTHVAVVSEGVGGAFKAIYLNGTLATSAATSNGPVAALNGVQIGSWNNLRHRGMIDDFRIYGRVLTQPEIATLAGQNPLAAPTGLAFTATPASVTLTWNAVAGATSYTVSRTPPGGVLASGITGTSYVDNAVSPGVTYSYTVAAVGMVDGPNSAALPVPVPFPPPRTDDHEEGLFGESCSCGASTSGPGPLCALLALLALRRRRN